MRKPILTAALALFMAAPLACAQEQDAPTDVYLAYFKVGYDDLAAWTTFNNDVARPFLDQMVADGRLEGYGFWQHSTGGEYNWRMAIRSPAWDNFDEFWSEYIATTAEADPDGNLAGMIQAHYDEIWTVTHTGVPEDATAPAYLYDSNFQIGFNDLETWEAAWMEHVAPMLDQAVADGGLNGWVIENHNTGGRYNWKVIYLFDAWDDMDDFFDGVLGSLMGNAEVWNQIAPLIQAHDDLIWAAVPTGDGM